MGRRRLSALGARFVGEAPDDRPGFGLGGGGDLDEDGLDDVVIGADREDAAGEDAGAAYVVYGRARRLRRTVSLARADAKLVGESAGDRAGLAATIAGDLDDDGFDELVVGAFGHDTAGADAGAAYVVRGGARRLRGTRGLGGAHTRLLGETAGDAAGGSVGPAGDLDGDDVDDLMVGADAADAGALDGGAVYVLFGRGG